jgi:hypothetical protein
LEKVSGRGRASKYGGTGTALCWMLVPEAYKADRSPGLKAFRRTETDAMYSLDMVLEVVDIVENYLISLA